MGAVDAARHRQHPSAGNFVHNRHPNKGAGRVVIAPVGEEIAIRRIDDRDGPSPGKADYPAGVVDQRNSIGLGESLQPIDKKPVYLLGRHQPLELVRVRDACRAHHRLRFPQHQIYRLKGTGGLLGEDNCKVLGVLHFGRDPVTPQMANGEAASDDSNRNKDNGSRVQTSPRTRDLAHRVRGYRWRFFAGGVGHNSATLYAWQP